MDTNGGHRVSWEDEESDNTRKPTGDKHTTETNKINETINDHFNCTNIIV